MRANEISGAAARKWRKQVAQFSKRTNPFVRTLKFPLDVSNLEVNFQKIASLYETTEGLSDKSLIGLLCAVHLSGFRLFSKAPEAQLFLNSLALPTEEFREKWAEQTESENCRLTPEEIISLIITRPRRNPTYESKPVTEPLYKLATGKNIADSEPDDLSAVALRLFGENLQAKFPARHTVADDPNEALRIFDAAVASVGLDLPSLEQAYLNQKELTPKGSTIAHDDSLPTLPANNLDEFQLHQVIAQKLRGLIKDETDSADKLRTEVQNAVTTATNNALSWLFGLGFQYWRETDLNKIVDDYQIKADKIKIIKLLKARFDAIPEDRVFGSRHYSNFRSSIGGKIDSWIANYLKQLDLIRDAVNEAGQIIELPEELNGVAYKEYFSGTGVNFAQLQNLLNLIPELSGRAKTSLSKLLGLADELPTGTEIEYIEQFSEYLSMVEGLFTQLSNRVEQERESKNKERAQLSKKITINKPAWLKPLPRINRISGGLPDYNTELRGDVDKFNRLHELNRDHFESVKNWLRSNNLADPIADLKSQEASIRSVRNLDLSDDILIIEAKRKVVQRLGAIVKSSTDEVKKISAQHLSPIFLHTKDLNKFIFNQIGALYRSPFSNSRHEAYAIDQDFVKALDLELFLVNLLKKVKAEFESNIQLNIYRDYLRIENLYQSYCLQALPQDVPMELAEEFVSSKHFKIPGSIALLLEQKLIPKEIFLKLFNLYQSERSGLLAKLFRESFVLKTKFVRVDQNDLYFVPKEKSWRAPSQFISSTIYKVVADSLKITEGVNIDALHATTKLLNSKLFNKDRSLTPFNRALTQIPHDWYIDLEFSGSGESDISGLKINKDGIAKQIKKLYTPARLVGASSYKTLIDKWVTRKDYKFGEYNLMFLQSFKQKAMLSSEGILQADIETTALSAEVALTITEGGEVDLAEHPIAEHLIGIDLGEAGIGFAVFRADKINDERMLPIYSGSIPIRTIRNLIKRVGYHRKKIQPMQKFQQRFNNSLEILRKNVAGDVVHIIDSLCWKYRGFPVLESSVRNLASGGAQLKLIYDKVLNIYTYSETPAHRDARKSHWCGSETWEHPYLLQKESKQDSLGAWEKTGKDKPVYLFPGVSVHPAGTSQTCSLCRNNPITELYEAVDKRAKIIVDSKGEAVLPSGRIIRIKSRFSLDMSGKEKEEKLKYARRQKENLPYLYPIREGVFDAEYILSRVRRQLRGPQKSTRSRDTSQSRYNCVYKDCENTMHADENAAINIVNKWIKDRGVHIGS